MRPRLSVSCFCGMPLRRVGAGRFVPAFAVAAVLSGTLVVAFVLGFRTKSE